MVVVIRLSQLLVWGVALCINRALDSAGALLLLLLLLLLLWLLLLHGVICARPMVRWLMS
jgi:hypothetical protein